MPELPEIERLRLDLLPVLCGATVTNVRVYRRDIIIGPSRSQNLLRGSTITNIDRCGKELALIAGSQRAITIHLGMSGQLLHLPPHTQAPNSTHIHVIWTLTSKKTTPLGRLIFRDPRRFGGIHTFRARHDLYESRWAGKGPDALTITAKTLSQRITRSQRAIKSALLDQSVLAGVGNIYADEALFRAHIDPARLCTSLTHDEYLRLTRALRAILRAAITSGGSTIRDYRTLRDQPGSFQSKHQVYARAGKPCIRCKAILIGRTIAQRTTVHCPVCQPSNGAMNSTSLSGKERKKSLSS